MSKTCSAWQDVIINRDSWTSIRSNRKFKERLHYGANVLSAACDKWAGQNISYSVAPSHGYTLSDSRKVISVAMQPTVKRIFSFAHWHHITPTRAEFHQDGNEARSLFKLHEWFWGIKTAETLRRLNLDN